MYGQIIANTAYWPQAGEGRDLNPSLAEIAAES